MSLDGAAIERAAAALGAARLARRAVGPLPSDRRPMDEDDGYRVQDALKDRLARADGMAPAGFKIGATTPVMRDMLGVPGPARGWIRGGVVHRDGADLPARRFLAPGIECEIAFRIGRDLERGPRPSTREEAAAAVAEVMPAIEIVDNRYGDWAALGVPTLIADDFFQAACVLGAPAAGIDPMRLDAVRGRTLIDGESIGEGRGADVLGHPLDAVIWLVEALARAGQSLRAGQIVMTGSMVRPLFLDRFPVDARVEIDGLGSVAARLA